MSGDFFSSGAALASTTAGLGALSCGGDGDTDDPTAEFASAVESRAAVFVPVLPGSSGLALVGRGPTSPGGPPPPSSASEIAARRAFPIALPSLSKTSSAPLIPPAVRSSTFPPAGTAPTISPSAISRYQPVTPQQLSQEILGSNQSSLSSLSSPSLPSYDNLILDIRPFNHWQRSRIIGSISLSIPTTLLRRPKFPLESISAMLPVPSDRDRFLEWKRKTTDPSISPPQPRTRLIVYDHDSGPHSLLAAVSNMRSILDKFVNEGFDGPMLYVTGGFMAVQAEAPSVLDDSDPLPSIQKDEENRASNQRSPDGNRTSFEISLNDRSSHGAKPEKPSSGFLSVRNLSMSAFQQSSTTMASQRPQFPTTSGGTLPIVPAPPPTTTKLYAANPFYDNIRQNLELSTGITERIPLYLPLTVFNRVDELPFEWLKEIVHLGISRESGVNPTPHIRMDSRSQVVGSSELGVLRSGSAAQGAPTEMRSSDVTEEPTDEGMQALAMQFYRIELGEQRRLMGVMEHHSKESEVVSDISQVKKEEPDYFPYSITAGIEMGDKNRYRNIWPFDHARVRLRNGPSDYVNASYIQPRGTNRKYIATQGPLPSTFTDFWTLCWQQNIRVIVMLTRRKEGNSVKCGYYWEPGNYGPLTLQLVKREGDAADEDSNKAGDNMEATGGFDFGTQQPKENFPYDVRRANSSSGGSEEGGSADDTQRSDEIIRRTFLLYNSEQPSAPPRTIVQLQFVGWPDLDVPKSPRNLLKLIAELNGLIDEYEDSGVVGMAADQCKSEQMHTSQGRSQQEALQSRIRRADSANPVLSQRKHSSPVLVHCSAGVGRTGSFVMIDSILNAIRREIALPPEQRAKKETRSSPPEPSSQQSQSTTPEDEVQAPPMNVDSVPIGVTQTTEAPPIPSIPRRYSALTGDPLQMTNSPNPMLSNSISPPGSLPQPSKLPTEMKLRLPQGRSQSLSTSSSISVPVPSLFHPPQPRSFAQIRAGNDDAQSSTSGTGSSNSGTMLLKDPRKMDLAGEHVGITSSTEPSSLHPTGSGYPSVTSFNTKSRGSSISQNKNETSFDFTMPRAIHLPQHSVKYHTHVTPARQQRSGTKADFLQPFDLIAEEESQSGSNTEEVSREPSPLSAMEEPVREVLEDVRQQRMSMCQSLRQYVFVHRSIVEGALAIVDELKEKEDSKRRSELGSGFSGNMRLDEDSHLPPFQEEPEWYSAKDEALLPKLQRQGSAMDIDSLASGTPSSITSPYQPFPVTPPALSARPLFTQSESAPDVNSSPYSPKHGARIIKRSLGSALNASPTSSVRSGGSGTGGFGVHPLVFSPSTAMSPQASSSGSLTSAKLMSPPLPIIKTKRLASPTELVRADGEGQTLNKRPSTKRLNPADGHPAH